MPHPISVEQIARVRAAVRRHGERSADRQAELERLVTATEVGARQVSAALSRPTTATRDCVDQLCAALRAQSRRARAAVTLTRHLCIGAREDCLADRRLLSELGEDPAERTPETPYTSRSVLVVDDYEDSRNCCRWFCTTRGSLSARRATVSRRSSPPTRCGRPSSSWT